MRSSSYKSRIYIVNEETASQNLISQAELKPKHFKLLNTAYLSYTCANSEDPDQTVPKCNSTGPDQTAPRGAV